MGHRVEKAPGGGGKGRNEKNDAQADKESTRTHTIEGPLRGSLANYVVTLVTL